MPDLIAKGLTDLQVVQAKNMLKSAGITKVSVYDWEQSKFNKWERRDRLYKLVIEKLFGHEKMVIGKIYRFARGKGYPLKREMFDRDIDALASIGKLEKTTVKRKHGGLKTILSQPVEERITTCSIPIEEQVALRKNMEGEICDTKNMP
jgi:hypothetical protein